MDSENLLLNEQVPNQDFTPKSPTSEKGILSGGEEQNEFDFLAQDFLSNRFTAHSFPNIAAGRSHGRRIFWSCVSLILSFILAVLISHLMREFFKYPKQVTIEVCRN